MHPVSTEYRIVAYLVIPGFNLTVRDHRQQSLHLHDVAQHGHAAKGLCCLAAGHIFLSQMPTLQVCAFS